MLTTRHDDTVIYTPFPAYEREVASSEAVTTRTTYRLARQIVAVRSAGTLYYTYTDHLGNVIALSDQRGNLVNGNDARYDPFGTFTTRSHPITIGLTLRLTTPCSNAHPPAPARTTPAAVRPSAGSRAPCRSARC